MSLPVRTPEEREQLVEDALNRLAEITPDQYGMNMALREILRCRALVGIINNLIGRDENGDGLLSVVIETEDVDFDQVVGFRRFIKPGKPVGKMVG